MFQHLRLMSQFDSPRPEVTRMVPWYGFYEYKAGYHRMMAAARANVPRMIQALRKQPPGWRAIDLQWLMLYETNVTPWGGVDPLKIYERGEVDISRSLDQLEPLSKALKRRRLPIDLIYVDHEGGFDYFVIGKKKIGEILRSPKARAKMPPALRRMTEEDFEWTNELRDNKILWGKYADQLRFGALKKLLVDSGLFDIPSPQDRSVTVRPQFCNFYTFLPTFPIYDQNGWPLSSASIDGRSSSGAPYMTGRGQRYTDPRRQHHGMWNEIIDQVNHARSCLARPNATYHPMMIWPSSTGYWAWETLVAHLARTGVCWTTGQNAFLYFNQYKRELDDPAAVEILKRHDQPWPVQRNLPEIPLDSDVIETAGYVTTYEDFLANHKDPQLGG